MARLDIEDEFFDDAAIVAAKMGDIDRAHGQAIRLIRWAQLQYRAEKPTMLEEFLRKGFSELLVPEFVMVDGEQVVVRGAAKHFAWIEKKRRAGQAGAAKTNKKRWGDQQKSAKVGKSHQTSPTSTISSTISSSGTSENPSGSAKAQALIAAYCERFKARWESNPEITGKDAGIAKRLAKDLSGEKIDLYLDAFFAMPDAWLVKTKHPLAAFETKLNEVVVFADSGQFTTTTQARQVDDSVALASQIQRIREGKL